MDTTWRKGIAAAMAAANDPGPIIACTLDDAALDKVFDGGYGVSEGEPFTAWTAQRVYFPAVYDGAEWVGSAPRNPCGIATAHIGGE